MNPVYSPGSSGVPYANAKGIGYPGEQTAVSLGGISVDEPSSQAQAGGKGVGSRWHRAWPEDLVSLPAGRRRPCSASPRCWLPAVPPRAAPPGPPAPRLRSVHAGPVLCSEGLSTVSADEPRPQPRPPLPRSGLVRGSEGPERHSVGHRSWLVQSRQRLSSLVTLNKEQSLVMLQFHFGFS